MIGGDLHLVILDRHAMHVAILVVQIIIRLLPGEGDPQGQFHLDTEGTESDLTQGLPMGLGAIVRAEAGVVAWTTQDELIRHLNA